MKNKAHNLEIELINEAQRRVKTLPFASMLGKKGELEAAIFYTTMILTSTYGKVAGCWNYSDDVNATLENKYRFFYGVHRLLKKDVLSLNELIDSRERMYYHEWHCYLREVSKYYLNEIGFLRFLNVHRVSDFIEETRRRYDVSRIDVAQLIMQIELNDDFWCSGTDTNTTINDLEASVVNRGKISRALFAWGVSNQKQYYAPTKIYNSFFSKKIPEELYDNKNNIAPKELVDFHYDLISSLYGIEIIAKKYRNL